MTVSSPSREQWLPALVEHAYEHAASVRQLLDGAGIDPNSVHTIEDLSVLPITRKDALIDRQRLDPPFGGFLGTLPQQLVRIFVSPGPLFDPQGPEPDYWRFAQALRTAGFTARDVVLNASSYHMTPMGLMLSVVRSSRQVSAAASSR
jgi:phenylacetate-CoA ligase